ncbi:hypothetical protein F1880_005771 [Penicillium rolfsii]|nr:hypothetical protein F1880_005771 [Penicillium rolfsii]
MMDASGRQCVVCPTKPVFSDVSHLLTHLLSKGHLSQKNKLELRLNRDDAAATALLTAYEDWYSANNLGLLLAERHAAKDDHKNKRRSSGQNAWTPNTLIPPVLIDPGAVAAASTPFAIATTTPLATGSRRQQQANSIASTVAIRNLPDNIDPRLGEPYGSYNDGSDTKGAPTDPSIVGWPPVQLMLQDFDARNAYSPGNTELASRNDQSATLPVTPEPLYNDLNSKSNFYASVEGGMLDPDRSTNSSSQSKSSSLSTSGAIDPYEVDEKQSNDNARSEEAIRLKGVQWPGMDLFDAATPEMRRKRNQKKDGTLVKQLETTSQQIEPTEQIFKSMEGLPFQIEREITGKVEDYPPLEGESPIAKKGPLKGKPGMLRERDANIPRARDTKRVKRENPRSADREGLLESTGPGEVRLNQGKFGSACDEADEDLRLSVRSSRLTVFRDEQDQIHAESAMVQGQDILQAQATMQAPRGTLAPAQLALNITSIIPHNHEHKIPLNNENIEPMMNIGAGGGFESSNETWNSTLQFVSPNRDDGNVQFVNTNVSDDNGYFYGDSIFSHGGFVPCYGFQANPFYGATSATMFSHQSYDEEFTLTNGGWTDNSQAMASGAGPIEGDHHQLNQLHMKGYQY